MGLSADMAAKAVSGNVVASSITLRSPVSGVVTAREISPGSTVNRDRKAFTIVSLSPIWIEVEVFQEDIPKIFQGQSVMLKTPSGSSLTGRVSTIGSQINEQSKTLQVRIISENRNGQLKPGMFVNAELVTGTLTGRLLVPASAVVEVDGRQTVYVKSGKYFEPIAVQVGSADAGKVEITDGLFEGDEVVVHGAKQLYAQSLLSSHTEETSNRVAGTAPVVASPVQQNGPSPILMGLALAITGALGVLVGILLQRRSNKTLTTKVTEYEKIC
jgi:cobalt-zinc-cadmium efflux system membrane fusion protein